MAHWLLICTTFFPLDLIEFVAKYRRTVLRVKKQNHIIPPPFHPPESYSLLMQNRIDN